ncbi:MAG: hypothetical protein ORN54_07985, partial [Cyclobacteriaceae bacterium]|nr:hypothetical protein [Cyclobacteriaceae bacterium]
MKFNFIKKFVVLTAVSVLVFLQSCEKEPDPVVKVGAAGFFVVNEGAFGTENSSVSFYDRKTDAVSNDLFAAKNKSLLGNQAQSMTLFEGKAYVVLQASNNIKIINPDDFSLMAVIGSADGIESPRYFLGISSSKAYVSDWGANGITGTLKVIDLVTNKVTKSIATGKGTNRMLKVGNLVYVANAGGYGTDNTVKVIDSNTDAVVASITTGDNPNSLQKDNEGNIWVTADGAEVYD